MTRLNTIYTSNFLGYEPLNLFFISASQFFPMIFPNLFAGFSTSANVINESTIVVVRYVIYAISKMVNDDAENKLFST